MVSWSPHVLHKGQCWHAGLAQQTLPKARQASVEQIGRPPEGGPSFYAYKGEAPASALRGGSSDEQLEQRRSTSKNARGKKCGDSSVLA